MFKKLQLINGSYINASSTAIMLSLLSLSTFITISQVFLKLPSIPQASKAFVNIRVSLKGTFSGNFSLFWVTSQQSPKSMCTIRPVTLYNIILEGCLSPRPNIYPTIDMVANDRVYVVLLSNQISLLGD